MKKMKWMIALAALTGLTSWTATHAAFVVTFKDLTNSVTKIVADESLDDVDGGGVEGFISFTYTAPGGSSTTISASSNSTLPDTFAELQQTKLVQQAGSGTGFLQYQVTVTDSFDFPGSVGVYGLNSRLTGSITSGVGSTLSFFSEATPSYTSTPALTHVATNPVTDIYSGFNSVPFTRTSQVYTLSNTLDVTILETASGVITGVTVVPEPASMASLLVAPALLVRRRAR